MKAVVFERDCGATTGFSTQVSIIEAGEPLPNNAGNIFTAADSIWVEVLWKSEHQLVITYAADADIGRKEAAIKGISVEYLGRK